MSKLYDRYLVNHKSNVIDGFEWIKNNIPDVLDGVDAENMHTIIQNHDASKTDLDEYEAYDKYFYGNNRSYEVSSNFNYAWLAHQHKNKHHWQHYILVNDDPHEGDEILEMPREYIIEMICDWWSFSWTSGNLMEIFDWYDKRASYIKLSWWTRSRVETVLNKMEVKLKELENEKTRTD